MKSRRHLLQFFINLAAIALVAAFAPLEKTLGANVRIVYLHGVWVWAALVLFVTAAVAGLVGLLTRSKKVQQWSRALGRSGLVFWITYLPISMWAMQANWNGLFLAEPRFRLAVIFSISGLLLQLGVTLLEDPAWASGGNLLFAIALFTTLRTTQNVMHPPAPILNSNAPLIQGFFAAMLILTLLLAWQVTRWLYRIDAAGRQKNAAPGSPQASNH